MIDLYRIRNGDVISFQGRNIFARAIRFWTKQPTSHVGMAVWLDEYEMLCVLEAMEGSGVRMVPLSSCLRRHQKVYWHQMICPELDRKVLVETAMAEWSRSYANVYQFLVIMSPRLRWLRRLLGKSFDTNIDRWFCSELIANAFKSAGATISKDPALTTPGDIVEYECLADGILLRCG